MMQKLIYEYEQEISFKYIYKLALYVYRGKYIIG